MSAMVPTRVNRWIKGTGWLAVLLLLLVLLLELLLLLVLPLVLLPLLLLVVVDVVVEVVLVVVDGGVRVIESGLGFPCPSTGT